MPSFLKRMKELETNRPREKFTPLEPRASVRRQAREAKKAARLKTA